MNNYKLLGLQNDEPIDKIHKAYKELAKKYHPDTSTGDVEKFLVMKDAYDELIGNLSGKSRTNGNSKKQELNRAFNLYKKHDYVKSSAVIRNYLLNNENDTKANFLYGTLMRKFGKLHMAESCFKKVTAVQPYNTDALLNLAAIHKDIGLKSLAKKEINLILKWDKDNREASMMLKDLEKSKLSLKSVIKKIIGGEE